MRVLVRSRLRKRRINKKAVSRFAEFVMKRAGCPRDAELSVVFLGRRAMRSLNGRYRGVERDTDVLAFGFDEGEVSPGGGALLGDVVVSVDMARRQARSWGTSVNRELLLYIVHGILHLAGSEDETPGDRGRMESRQEDILRAALNARRWIVIS